MKLQQKVPGDHRRSRDVQLQEEPHRHMHVETYIHAFMRTLHSCICFVWEFCLRSGAVWLRKRPAAVGCLTRTTSVSLQDGVDAGAGGVAGAGDAAVVSVVAGKPVKHEGGRADLPGSGCCEPRRHGDRRSQQWTQEAQGGLPRGEQQVQVRRVRHRFTHLSQFKSIDD